MKNINGHFLKNYSKEQSHLKKSWHVPIHNFHDILVKPLQLMKINMDM